MMENHKKILIDASHAEETRVAVLKDNNLEDFDYETSSKTQLKGNIYLAQVIRVEPSLQAAFLEFGGNKHGFLAFNEIHPDYYQIPVEDQQKLLQTLSEEAASAFDADNATTTDEKTKENIIEETNEDYDIDAERAFRLKLKSLRAYKIQEVVKRKQVMLVRVMKDERIIRGSSEKRAGKGAALTTYLSIPGRYCVLMPNTPRGGGVSRKISNLKDRTRLKKVISSFNIPETMGLIVRTAGMERTKQEIKKDYDYLLRTWNNIREKTLQSKAPSLIYESGDLITRCVRDLYTKDIEEILVEGEEGYRRAKKLMRMLMPSHSKRVQLYQDHFLPLFQKYAIEDKIDVIDNPSVPLPSGGYIVINQTEALVAIDVNSGQATRERTIDDTALKTNLEAAEMIARQLRLRDLSGLVVIDFIDMNGSKSKKHLKNNTLVENKLNEALSKDRARIQVGRISSFGLLEMSRQRLRLSLAEANSTRCFFCQGSGMIRSVESSALRALRAIEKDGILKRFSEIIVYLPSNVSFYVLNQKRNMIVDLEKRYDFSIKIVRDDGLVQPNFRIERTKKKDETQPQQEMPLQASDKEKLLESKDVPERKRDTSKLKKSSSKAWSSKKNQPSKRNTNNRKKDTSPPEESTEAPSSGASQTNKKQPYSKKRSSKKTFFQAKPQQDKKDADTATNDTLSKENVVFLDKRSASIATTVKPAIPVNGNLEKHSSFQQEANPVRSDDMKHPLRKQNTQTQKKKGWWQRWLDS